MNSKNGRPLKIAYMCDISPEHVNPYSGGNTRIYNALCKHAGEVTILSNSWHLAEPIHRLIYRMPDAVSLRLRYRAHLALAAVIARGVHRELLRDKYDVLFGAYSFHSLYRVTPPYPMVTAYTSDATPTSYKRSEVGQYFGSYLRASRLLDPLILRAETSVFSSRDLLFWPGEWQKNAIDPLHGLTDEQSRIVPWGANIDDPGVVDEPPSLSNDTPVRLHFIGRDWKAKGGPFITGVLRTLLTRGIKAELSVVGCTPPDEDLLPEVKVYASLDKSIPEELALFERLLREAHFLTMASFESWGFAYCEASAYGLPSLCLRLGGIPVFDGVNGHALPGNAKPEDFADTIAKYLNDPSRYAALRRSTRRIWENELNWDAWGKSVAAQLREAVANKEQ
ncbi:MAG: glycosyl transferase [Gammaproteobacteria bacterium]|nr:MAG: glycosyl transferase [Gammaproteobacteria bacterium]